MNKHKFQLFTGVTLFLTLIIFLYLRSNYREKCLIKTKLTFAILNKISSGNAKGSSFIQFNFTNTDGKIVTTDHIGHFSICERGMVKGDTILIKYSIEDNSVAQIVKC